MASTNQSSMMQQDEGEDEEQQPQHHHHHLQSMSRLSLCGQDHDHGSGGTGSHMSLLSIENFDADEEVSDKEAGKEYFFPGKGILSSDSDKEAGCYSLPATPPRRRRRIMNTRLQGNKDYASDNELILVAQSGAARSRTRRRRRSAGKDTWPPVERQLESSMRKKKEEVLGGNSSYLNSSAGESDHSGVMVITRPKGGRRSLCMGLEEVKACNELGFELEHEHIMPCISVGGGSGHDFDTSSGNNSPIANWRISSPGDDPRDVKARLKVWAQAVALASTSGKGLDIYS